MKTKHFMNSPRLQITGILLIIFFLACQSSSTPLSPTEAGSVIYQIEDYRYLEDRYFFLDESYREHFKNKTRPAEGDQIDVSSVRIFLNDYNVLNDVEDQAFPSIAYAFWKNGLPYIQNLRWSDKNIQEGMSHELAPDDFTAYPEGYIVYERGRVNTVFDLAAIFQTKSGTIQGSMVLINQENQVQLKLIKARHQRAGDPTYNLSWRNVYSIGQTNMPPDGLSIHIKKVTSDFYFQEGVLLSQVLGLNVYKPENNTVPGWNLTRGHFIFPDIEPFVNDPLLEKSENIYIATNPASRAEQSKYMIEIRRLD